MVGMEEGKDKGGDNEDWKEVRGDRIMEKRWTIYISSPKVREQMEVERRRGEAELRGEIRREVDKLREEVAEVQVITLVPHLVQMSTTICILITP